ncbi:uncharacterized protein LOC131597525 [Vicia villosa]|uniref:uncharacterized protein LOC131597525 n=1 Tax=Vicia villosa TaxID=3911 RepID=UPI00273B17D5|nr:uncharacterized protein LOC131597525 [Vicia villosa]
MDEPTDPRLKSPAIFQNPSKTTEEESGPKYKSSNLKEKGEKEGETEEKEAPYVPPPTYKPHIPYPQRTEKSKSIGQFKKFVELLKQLNITIPFIEAITQIPSYAKFLKEILSNRKKIEDSETVTLTAECSAIIQNKMPPKLKDPRSFSIPCNIGKFVIDKALCDLGASISLMPLSICEKLNMVDLRPTKMSVQLADRFVKYPVGVLENVPVRIGQFYILTDFIIMDIKEDVNTPIILGRPFLATAGAIIDVKKGKLTFAVGEEKVKFILTQFLQAPAIEDTCYLVDVIDGCVREIGLSKESYFEVIKIPMPLILEDDNWRLECRDDSLSECLALTPNPMPYPKKPTLDLKPLPKTLRYEFLDNELKRPVIVNAELGGTETEKMLQVLRKYPSALGYNIFYLKWISPSICMHRIMLEEDCKTSREHQRRINPILSTVVKDEVTKLLNAGIIYPIFDSQWRCMMSIFDDYIDNIMGVFMDDFSVCGGDFEGCLSNLGKVLDRCVQVNLVLNWEKCHFMVKQGIVLGHVVSERGIEVDKAKIEVIENLQPPKTVREIRSFLGHTGFYKRFIKDFSKISKPLTNLLMRDVEFNFNNECLEAFEVLKTALISAPIMQPPDWNLPFEIICDASDYAVGAVLGQRKDKKLHAVYYTSRTLDPAQMNFTTTEKELLVVVFALDKFRSYLIGAKIIVYTEHATIRYLLAKQDVKPRLLRWILLLQQFDLEIKDKKGAENVVAGHLSRMEGIKPEETPINDDFPYECLIAH